MQMLQDAIAKHTGNSPAAWPQPIPTADYGSVKLNASLQLLSAVPALFPGEGIPSSHPVNMEEYDQG